MFFRVTLDMLEYVGSGSEARVDSRQAACLPSSVLSHACRCDMVFAKVDSRVVKM